MTHSGPGSSKRRRYRGPWQSVAERKQLQLKAIQRPMLKSPPSSSVGRRTIKSPMAEWRSGSSFN
ncbi:unnamed protein product [Staurois parvus]|uniref:Uncharacterized protein n=1 Tax=Staurois parvus TaxID=386267 RepID=A0ABN9E8A2_9NEOB|nr:unnamed protein product [Staurois parvus]